MDIMADIAIARLVLAECITVFHGDEFIIRGLAVCLASGLPVGRGAVRFHRVSAGRGFPFIAARAGNLLDGSLIHIGHQPVEMHAFKIAAGFLFTGGRTGQPGFRHFPVFRLGRIDLALV